MSQLPLALALRADSTLDNFIGAANAQIVAALRAIVAEAPPLIYLWGAAGSGKTHLLEAACRLGESQGRRGMLVPLALPELTPAVLEHLEHQRIVCIDDIDRIAQHDAWERALFNLYERARGHATTWIVAGAVNPRGLGLRLADLSTRLGAGVVYQLQTLTDAEKIIAMRARAQARGLEMSDEVARYVFSRYPRDLPSLLDVVARLDTAALAQQRRLTMPFVRSLETYLETKAARARDGE